MSQKITLKEAREKGKLDQFIKEREKAQPGDADRFEKLLSSAAGVPAKSAPKGRKPSKKGSSGD